MSNQQAEKIREYWNTHLHDMAIVKHDVGTRGFFEDLAEYRFDKNRYLPKVADFEAHGGKKLLEVGCGVGIDLALFAKGGAHVTGVDLSELAIELGRTNFEQQGLEGDLRVMDAHQLEFENDTFDFAFAHGVLPYVLDAEKIVAEMHRVLKPGGEALVQAYNKRSWFYPLSKIMKVALEHSDAPAFRIHTVKELKRITASFSKTNIIYERFPVKTRLHKGLKGKLYNSCFVGAFNIIPRPLVRGFGWHIMARSVK